ncbi:MULTISPECIES: NADPH-dependent oxidoreductase [unclassified Paludibacterium]|uniref:NADPH-dependent oxidoreductase n=1 Tax=unclassified Paludibacterium TaxID=2618429 RepID=UPI001C03D3FB|nr:NADPH-dependent oxidoreductase [Paludibacterium sp. B53371]BEV71966.1 NADPH-dependent oxidoreductase [Paludibacterium sp. THUN1379]
MNPTLAQMHQHHSVRSYQDKPIDPALLDAILDAAWHGPTSINGQQVSLVVVQDAARRARIADIAGGQPWIARAPVFVAVVMDFHKTAVGAELAGESQAIHNSVEGFAVGAVDAGIALGNLMTAARSAGLGVVPIGGIRRDPQAMIELLDLPPRTLAIAGVVIGHVEQDGSVKPRLPRVSFVHHERYDSSVIAPSIRAYDETLQQYWQSQGRLDGQPWSVNTAQTYKTVYFPLTAVVARQQGFGFDQ